MGARGEYTDVARASSGDSARPSNARCPITYGEDSGRAAGHSTGIIPCVLVRAARQLQEEALTLGLVASTAFHLPLEREPQSCEGGGARMDRSPSPAHDSHRRPPDRTIRRVGVVRGQRGGCDQPGRGCRGWVSANVFWGSLLLGLAAGPGNCFGAD